MAAPSLVLALACCAWRDGALAVLVPAGGRAALPQAPLATALGPDAEADAFARHVLGRAPAWRSQVGVLREGAVLLLVYAAVVSPGTEAPAGYRWAALGRAVPAPVQAAIAHLQARLDQEPIAFRLLGPTFTLSDLQQVYERLLGRRVHKASFRRTLLAAHLVEPTDAWRSEGRGRPAQLFRYAPRRRRALARAVRFDLLS
jgi:ADP-ribose pyrophosphatase YjhB (NUDIX family)